MVCHQNARKKLRGFFHKKTLALPCIVLRICSPTTVALTLIAQFSLSADGRRWLRILGQYKMRQGSQSLGRPNNRQVALPPKTVGFLTNFEGVFGPFFADFPMFCHQSARKKMANFLYAILLYLP
jgi:hypothetical protein